MGVTRASRPIRAFEGAPGAAAPQPLEQGLDEAHQPLPEIKHHDDENGGEDDLPIGDLVAQIGGQDADQDRADDRAVQRRPPADSGPDHEIGRKDEAAQLRGDEILLGRIEGAADSGEHAAEAEHGGFHILHREAAETHPLLVLGNRPPQDAGRRAPEPCYSQQTDRQRDRGDVVQVGEIAQPRQARDVLEAVEAAGNVVPAVGDLKGEQGERERDHGEERAAQGSPAEHEQADAVGQQARGQRRRRQQEQQ